jgi:ABC-type Zn uptake system ZnuABC Zn-binding protein ZnuA
MYKLVKLVLAVLLLSSLVACNSSTPGTLNAVPTSGTASPDARLSVVSTVAPIVNIIFNIAGDKVDLVGIIPEGTDSHTFEPAPSDAVKLTKGDLIFVNGLDLEAPTVKLAEANKKAGAEIINLGGNTLTTDQYVFDFSFPKEKGHPNPHLWMNPILALHYGEIVQVNLVKRDPNNAAYYQSNFAKFKTRINELDAAIMKSVQSIPEGQRKLLTYHDSFAYFAQRYPVTVIGAIQPADFAEPSPQDMAKLIVQIRNEHVPAIFGSEVFPSKVLEQIGKEAGARYIDTLRDDELPGQHGDKLHSYFGLMIEDVTTMVTVLGGDATPMKSIDPMNIPGGDVNVDQKK